MRLHRVKNSIIKYTMALPSAMHYDLFCFSITELELPTVVVTF